RKQRYNLERQIRSDIGQVDIKLTEKKEAARTSVFAKSIRLRSDLENIDQLLYGRCAFLQRGSFVVRKADLDDLLNAVLSQLDRYADEKIADAIFTFKEYGARQDLFLDFEYRLSHFNRSETWCI